MPELISFALVPFCFHYFYPIFCYPVIEVGAYNSFYYPVTNEVGWRKATIDDIIVTSHWVKDYNLKDLRSKASL